MGGNMNGFYHRISHDQKPQRYDLGIVDRLTKSTHFLAVNQKDNCEKLSEIYDSFELLIL
jgi:hypothetical protein